MSWHLLTGEYPPGCGGVGDHTRLLARALAGAGEEVHVWAPAGHPEPGVRVHPVPSFHGAGLAALDGALGPGDPARVLLVQYAPQAFGQRGANLAFCRWARRRARLGDEVRVVFHEPWVPFAPRPGRLVLASATRWMARLLLTAARRSYVSVPAWAGLLAPWAPRGAPEPQWLPVGATILPEPDPGAADAIRRAVGAGTILGHFGTHGEAIVRLLEPALAYALERSPTSAALLVGRGSAACADRIRRRRPELAARIHASPAATATEVSHAIQAFDVALQPYPDGATSRRTTLMAVLAHGVATATHFGRYSDPLWREAGFPLAASSGALGGLAARLLADAEARASSAAAAGALYRARFDSAVALRILLGAGRPATVHA